MSEHKWYAEECDGHWTLNVLYPDGCCGWIADFDVAGEEDCKQAAHEHNCHAALVAVVRELSKTPWEKIAIKDLQQKAIAALALDEGKGS